MLHILRQPQDFFKCLTKDGSEQGIWHAQIQKKMERMIFQRKIQSNDTMDHSANEIFHVHVKEMSAALGRANTAEAASRKLAIKTLWRTGGRAGEPGFLSYGGLRYERRHLSLPPCPSRASRLPGPAVAAGLT